MVLLIFTYIFNIIVIFIFIHKTFSFYRSDTIASAKIIVFWTLKLWNFIAFIQSIR